MNELWLKPTFHFVICLISTCNQIKEELTLGFSSVSFIVSFVTILFIAYKFIIVFLLHWEYIYVFSNKHWMLFTREFNSMISISVSVIFVGQEENHSLHKFWCQKKSKRSVFDRILCSK